MATVFMIDALQCENESFYLDDGFEVELLRDCRRAPSPCPAWFYRVRSSTSGEILKAGNGKTTRHVLNNAEAAMKRLRAKGITGW